MSCEAHRGSKVDASFVLFLEPDVGWLFVKSDAKALKLVFNEPLVKKRL